MSGQAKNGGSDKGSVTFTLDGQEVQLADLQGRTVLVNVFASWCAPCRLEAPHLVEAYNELDPDKFVFVGLNLQETPEAVAGALEINEPGFDPATVQT